MKSTASEQTTQAMQASARGLSQLNHCTPIVSELDQGIKQGAERIQHLAEKAREIENITEVINGIAEQTNLLALNAAIEAARAGEQGRGFAVVADEVRALAARTGEATGQIDSMLKVIISETQKSTQLMSGISEQSREVVSMVGDLSSAFVDINSLITSSSTAASQISHALEEQDATTSEISSSIVNIRDFLLNKSETTHHVSLQAQSLSTTAEQIFIYLSDFKTESMIDTMCEQAVITAKIIGERFEQAILSREISAIDLFNFKYQKIQNTQPQKFSSAFDHFTDNVLPKIQEPLLLEFTDMIYAGAVDLNGYFPTHNKKFSQPLTGNYQLDVNNNRTKRIFDDPTGSRCGAHKQRFLLQTYKRDTGEVLHDVSAPIWVNGKHWGGFRIAV